MIELSHPTGEGGLVEEMFVEAHGLI